MGLDFFTKYTYEFTFCKYNHHTIICKDQNQIFIFHLIQNFIKNSSKTHILDTQINNNLK